MSRFITFATFTTSLIASATYAQYPAGMSDADMQKMMQGAQTMMSCMQDVDPAAMDRLSTESQQLSADIKALCVAGNRDEAQAKALAFARDKADDPAMQAMIECGKQAQGMMPQVATQDELQSQHVCDMQ